jgi:PAS domain S-box-containing protein
MITNTRNDLVSKKFGNWQLDLVDQELIGSARYKASFGRAPDDPFTYEMFRASVHPDDRARLDETFRRAIEQIGDYETDYRCIWPDGSLHWINAWGLVIGDKGKATRMIGFTLDITERKQAEDDLRRNRDTFYNLVANSPFGVYVVDSEFRLREVSAGCQPIFSGVQPLLGRDFSQVLRII